MSRSKKDRPRLKARWDHVTKVWAKAEKKGFGYDPDIIREDIYGMEIHLNDYGKQTEFGWQIDHIKPVAKGGSDHMKNLQPLHWKSNLKKGDKYPFKPSFLQKLFWPHL